MSQPRVLCGVRCCHVAFGAAMWYSMPHSITHTSLSFVQMTQRQRLVSDAAALCVVMELQHERRAACVKVFLRGHHKIGAWFKAWHGQTRKHKGRRQNETSVVECIAHGASTCV